MAHGQEKFDAGSPQAQALASILKIGNFEISKMCGTHLFQNYEPEKSILQTNAIVLESIGVIWYIQNQEEWV